jgi:mxaL protein
MGHLARDIRFLALALAALLLAAFFVVSKVKRERDVYDILAVVDVTGSMLVRDMTGDKAANRIDAAKKALHELLAALPCQSKLGLGIFTERRSFVLVDPVEVCENFAPLSGSIAGLDWRMAWEGDSMVTKGLHNAIDLAAPVNADIVFLTDGQEAPPLPPGSGPPAFEGKPGQVMGLVVGMGARTKSPIPKFDDEGRETGSYGPDDVPQENRTGPPPPDAESRPGYHPKFAPFGSEPPKGDEHLSSVRFEHLTAIAKQAGLAYVELAQNSNLMTAIAQHAHAKSTTVDVDLRPFTAALALMCLIAAYVWPRTKTAPPAGYDQHDNAPQGGTMLRRVALAFLAALALTSSVVAHGPTPQKVDGSIEIEATPDAVWAVVKDFANVASWNPAVKAATGGKSNQPGAVRTITLANGGTLEEGLDDYSDAEKSYTYRLSKEDIKVFPVSFYSAKITVEPKGAGSLVTWSGRLYRADTGNFPPDDLNDEAAVKAMTAFINDGLAGLKARLKATQ